jgi:hypothetical protein
VKAAVPAPDQAGSAGAGAVVRITGVMARDAAERRVDRSGKYVETDPHLHAAIFAR